MPDSIPTNPAQTQTWAAILTAIAGAFGAVLAKKRFNKNKPPHSPPRSDAITRAEFHTGLDTVRDRIDANHRELLTTVNNQGSTIEKRLDTLGIHRRPPRRTHQEIIAPH